MNGHLILVILTGAVIYAAWAYHHPFRACPRCRGGGENRLSTRRRSGKCRRCGGSREVRTLGARALHRMARAGRTQIRNRKEK